MTISAPAPTTRRTMLPRWLAAVPLAWIAVALVHPMVDDRHIFEDIAEQVDLWIGVHLLQPFLALGLAVGIWRLVRDRDTVSARVTRIALPIWLVAFAVFDAVVGLATGLVVRHADGGSTAAEAEASEVVDNLALNHLTGDFSLLSTITATALVTAVVGLALSLRADGARRTVWGTALAGSLLAMHAGLPAAIGLAALAVTFVAADRREPAR